MDTPSRTGYNMNEKNTSIEEEERETNLKRCLHYVEIKASYQNGHNSIFLFDSSFADTEVSQSNLCNIMQTVISKRN